MDDSKNRQTTLLEPAREPESGREQRSQILLFPVASTAARREQEPRPLAAGEDAETPSRAEPPTSEDFPCPPDLSSPGDEPCRRRETASDLRHSLERVETADDLFEFTQDLLVDLGENWDAWVNACIHSFIDAVGYAATGVAHTGRSELRRPPSWKLFAAILYAARFYGAEDFEEWVEEFVGGLLVEGGDSSLIN